MIKLRTEFTYQMFSLAVYVQKLKIHDWQCENFKIWYYRRVRNAYTEEKSKENTASLS